MIFIYFLLIVYYLTQNTNNVCNQNVKGQDHYLTPCPVWKTVAILIQTQFEVDNDSTRQETQRVDQKLWKLDGVGPVDNRPCTD